MKYYRLFTILLVMLVGLFLSCSSNSTNKNSVVQELTDDAVASVSGIIDQSCASDPTIKFSYYLPKSFVKDKKYPVLLLFDPQGDAHFAI